MPEKGIAEKFTRILDDLERITDLGKRHEPENVHRSIDDILPADRPSLGNDVSLEYFRIVRILAWNEMFGGTAPKITYAAGEKIGRQLKVDSIDGLVAKIASLGLARAEVTPPAAIGGDGGQGVMTITFRESAVSAGLDSFHEPLCHFESGLLAGALEKLFRKKVTVTERKCAAQGNDFCLFEVALGERRRNRKALEEAITRLDYAEYSPENVELLSTLAAHAVTTLESALLFERTRKMVITDPLTGTYNFGYFATRIKEEIQRAERQNQSLSLVMVDLDGFKSLNDRYGHPAGDNVLREFARIIKENIRGIDILCRYGGDEFVLILPQTSREETAIVIERVRHEVAAHDFRAAVGETIRITASFGCAIYPVNSRYSDQLVEQADQALYEAKNTGRNRLCFFESPATAGT